MLCPSKLHALHVEVTTDERKEIDPGDDDIAAQDARRFLPDSKVGAESLENLRGKKCDLALVIFSIIKVAVSEQALARDTLDSFLLDQGRGSRRLAVVADEIVFGRNEDLLDLHVGSVAHHLLTVARLGRL